MRRCAIPQSYHKSRTSKRKRMTKGHLNKKKSHSGIFLDKSEHFQRDTKLRQMQQKNAGQNKGKCRIQSIFCSYLATGHPSFSNPNRWTQLKQPISNTGQYKTFQSKTKQLFCVVHQVGQTFSYQHSALQCNLTKYKHKLQSFPFLWKTSITFSFSENANRLDLLQSQPTFKTTAFVQMIQTDLFWFIIICRWRLLARAVFSL